MEAHELCKLLSLLLILQETHWNLTVFGIYPNISVRVIQVGKDFWSSSVPTLAQGRANCEDTSVYSLALPTQVL